MVDGFLNFLLAAVIIVVAAKLSGYISIRLGQPSVLGELIVGLLLGPTFLNMLGWPGFAGDAHLSESLALLAEVGVVLLMFLAGLELEIPELLKSTRVAALAGTLGVVVPLAAGYLTSRFFGLGTVQAVFVGLALSATSVSISAQTLMELRVLRSRVGLGLLGAAVFDDILVILFLSVAPILIGVGVTENASNASIWLILGQMALFVVAASAVGLLVLPRLSTLVANLPISQNITAFALVTAFVFAWAAEALGGIATITGAFLAGLFLARTPLRNEIEHGIAAMAYGLFVPIFFVHIGLEANLRTINGEAWVFAIVLTLVAIVTKVIGSGGGALLSGFNRLDSLRLGIGMISRGEVGLIVASVALVGELIIQETFSELVFVIIVATIVTPLLLRLSYRDVARAQRPPAARVEADESRQGGG